MSGYLSHLDLMRGINGVCGSPINDCGDHICGDRFICTALGRPPSCSFYIKSKNIESNYELIKLLFD